MVIGKDYVFIGVPRTASMSIASWLHVDHGGEWYGSHHETVVPAEHAHKFTFAVVRNPYERMASLWRYISTVFWPNADWRKSEEARQWQANGMVLDCDLETFVEWRVGQTDNRWWCQSDLLAGVRLDALLRFEDFPGCLAVLPFAESLDGLPHLGATERACLTAVQRAAIREHSWPDFAAYGYAI